MIGNPFLIAASGSLVAGLVLLALPATASAAETQATTVIQLGPGLDSGGSGTVEAFDASLGTLTGVTVAITTTVTLTSCTENNGDVDSSAGGVMQAETAITFPSAVTTAGSYNASIPVSAIAAYDGNDGCAGAFDPATSTFISVPGDADLVFATDTQADAFSATLTDPADLAPYVGPGDVPFTYAGDSGADVTLPGQWDAWFVADGEVSITITYTYDQTQLPATGSTTDTTTVAALIALAAGLGLVVFTRRRDQPT